MTDGPPNTFDTDVARIRLVLMRELETISVYEALARQATSPEIRAFFEHLAGEEKEHVAEAAWLLRKLDPSQSALFDKPIAEGHFEGRAPADVAPPPEPKVQRTIDANLLGRLPRDPRHVVHAIPAPPAPGGATFTVGSLKRRP
ncbi:MAG: ferritin [Myxococcaceae bacterium]|nr:ferritin [Myxococcaceae bacterium]